MSRTDAADVAEYRKAAGSGGDAAKGKAVFEREKTRCAACHTVGKGERKAGPDLLGVGDKFRRGKLIESILEPSKSTVAGYATSTLVLKDGRVVTGIVKRRDDSAVQLWVTTGEIESIERSSILKERGGKASLMPADLHKTTTPDEFRDLVAYLESLRVPGLAASASAGAPHKIPSIAKTIKFVPLHGKAHAFKHPNWATPVPGLKGCYVVIENDLAKAWLLDTSGETTQKTLFLDLSGEARTAEHRGMMGIAFHPRFGDNRRYFVNHHILEDGKFASVIIERRTSEDFRRDSGAPSRRLIRIDQNTEIHTGGMVEFGPDGFLYVGTGDGGPQTDPEGHAQDLRTLLGSILRIDVDRRDGDLPYAIPPSNPFTDVADPLARKEIWALGIRQAWRFSWDRRTRDLWFGDVGQDRFEEIGIVRQGENHGWNIYEGFLPFSDRFQRADQKYIPPILALARHHGVSVTAGYVYRGERSKSYDGVYIFGDYESKRVWGLTQKDRKLVSVKQIGMAPDRIASFGEDVDGEILMVGYDKGLIYRLELDESVFE